MAFVLNSISLTPARFSATSKLNNSVESLISTDSYLSTSSSSAAASKQLVYIAELANFPQGEDVLAVFLVQYLGGSANEDKDAFVRLAFEKVKDVGFDAASDIPTSLNFIYMDNSITLLIDLAQAGLRSVFHTASASQQFALHVVERPPFVFPFQSVSKSNTPNLEDWHTLWKAWDLVTLGMIPKSMLLQKPINLRHKCLFYIGHIPTFLDMMLVKTLGGKPCEPASFWDIFERGIDPHVDDPEHCHSHSAVPEADEDWPPLDTIILFRNRVRARLTCVYSQLASGEMKMTNRIARTLVMTHEHEGFHLETLLYMLIQRAGTGTIPPPGFAPPPFSHLPHSIPPTLPSPILGNETLKMGHEDNESLDFHMPFDAEREFGWDNESPAQTVHVDRFKAEWRCITNADFLVFHASSNGTVSLPNSWIKDDNSGKIQVRTIYGPVPLVQALDWPVQTAYNDLEAYARSKGGRLPTEPELRLFLDKYDLGQDGNVGFRNWNPLPGTTGTSTPGRGSNGGVWEWTSTLFDTHKGLSPTTLFTGYSTDFFDGVHHVVLGSSWATIPRLVSRRTIRNFYQHNYPYAWVGGRVVYDVKQ